jgi:hypothetical protein
MKTCKDFDIKPCNVCDGAISLEICWIQYFDNKLNELENNTLGFNMFIYYVKYGVEHYNYYFNITLNRLHPDIESKLNKLMVLL